jgi:hypothetical protein
MFQDGVAILCKQLVLRFEGRDLGIELVKPDLKMAQGLPPEHFADGLDGPVLPMFEEESPA